MLLYVSKMYENIYLMNTARDFTSHVNKVCFFLCRETTKWPLSGHVHINDRCVFCQLKVTLEWWIVVIMPTQTHSIFKSLVGSERFKNRRHQRETMVQTKKAGPKWDINLAWWYGAKMATLIFKWSNEYPYLRSDSGSSIHKSVGGHANAKKKSQLSQNH